MKTTKRPYEVLIRFREDGTLAAHVQWLYSTFDDNDVKVHESISDACPVGLDSATGFPIDRVLQKEVADAIAKFQHDEAAANKTRDDLVHAIAYAREADGRTNQVAEELKSVSEHRNRLLTDLASAASDLTMAKGDLEDRNRAVERAEAALESLRSLVSSMAEENKQAKEAAARANSSLETERMAREAAETRFSSETAARASLEKRLAEEKKRADELHARVAEVYGDGNVQETRGVTINLGTGR